MSVCINDTDGDGNCAACARNPEAPCRVSARQDLEWQLTLSGLEPAERIAERYKADG